MDLRTLKTFQAIVKHGSFNKAAQEMNYVQSTVTMQIQKLEAELGMTLFERGKEISLTEAGRLLYEQSMPIVKNMERLQASLSDLKLGESGHVRIGVTEPTASYRLPGILKKFMSKYPHIQISIEIMNTPSLVERIRAGEIDFALSTAPDLSTDLYFEPFFQEEFIALMPEDHPLAQMETVEPEALQGHRLLIASSTCPYRRKLETILQEKGQVALDLMIVGSITAMKQYVESGLGIALIPRIMMESSSTGTAARPVSGSLIHMTCGFICKESAYPLQLASHKLYQFLKQELTLMNG
ncbi:LysR family transcriptional regulator [Paenibacillus xylaniclasticus]|uniref:LysR family transcriptional regulator n=1 Tax=Paenibacillus xylaniclasticus TaxID=588083 RepID=UPI000FDCC63B|nr:MULTISPECIES: LysR family transcriptional regulator [Paenibacillus]GFN31619.1 HTH-type transcriptional regulator YtlI [Paenibacillus curdlanolyticus]